MHTILVTRRIFPEAEALLRARFRLSRTPDGAEGILTQLTDRVDAAFLDRVPGLRVVSQCAVGVDNIDLDEAARRGIAVMNTPGVLTESAADHTWALILAVARRIPEADMICRTRGFKGWDLGFMLGREVAGRTLGIVGAGRIGTAVARRALGFGMRVIYCRRDRGSPPPMAGMTRVGLGRLLREADIVSIHVPATPATLHLIGARELRLMKETAILVNTSRGAALDEEALVAALRRGSIWGAGLDVFEREPRIPASLRRSRRVVLTPHIASATLQTRLDMAMTAARNLVEFFAGRPRRGHLVVAPSRIRSREERRRAGPPPSRPRRARRSPAPR